ncbi:transcriptional regulator GcvA [Paraburkholderia lycopersici]|uniref:LysR family transcriptional regulator, glycine cleavage system transcriptional activator n=1 Tax=Paraburkholderia lycopersici TaxID=416944 RepID=A0A1G7BDV7_9BURK|nr:transcriptional regulator GcvA [Paraburkholderia lycopersici]SDE25288.1 LysR family transcriptional regulator, glycine cleavage system transcriptional activator [Paraburkholderia lycopersici]
MHSLKSRRLPPLNALRAFDASARHLNFRVASEELGVTQGAVAQQVRLLEDALNLALFDRLPRGLALTAEGHTYFVAVQRALTLLADATEALNRRSASLTISTTPSFASKWLIPRLAEFAERHPEIDVRIIADAALCNFRSDGVDIAVRLGKPPFARGLASDLLFPLDVFAVASPQFLKANVPVRTITELKNYVLLHDSHDLWPEFFNALGDTQSIDMLKGPRFSQSSLAIDAAIAGHGVALTSEHLVASDIAAGRLQRLFDFSLSLSLGYYVVFPQAGVRSETSQKMRDWLLAQFKSSANANSPFIENDAR